jgi:hypothetical protein
LPGLDCPDCAGLPPVVHEGLIQLLATRSKLFGSLDCTNYNLPNQGGFLSPGLAARWLTSG